MADHVYRRFTKDDLFHTTVHAQPRIVMTSGSAGWSSDLPLGNNSLSLYGDVRQRADIGSGSASGLELYPIDDVDTHSIDKVIGVPGQYPATGSVNLVLCTNDEPVHVNDITDTRWYQEHWSVINILTGWYATHSKVAFPDMDSLPATMSILHIPEMFYGRQIVPGSVLIKTYAWGTNAGVHGANGLRYFVDDGLGRVYDVPEEYYFGDGLLAARNAGATKRVGYIFYNEGLVVFTNGDPLWHQQFLLSSFNGNAPFHTQIQFDGSNIIKSFIFMCRMPPGEINASNNPTYYYTDSDGQRWAKHPNDVGENRTYTTGIGIYNEERQLVAVAKIAQPIRKRERDNIDVRLRLDI